MLQPLLTSHMKRSSRITGGASSCHRRVTNPIYALPPNGPELDIHVRIGLAGHHKTVLPTCAMWDRIALSPRVVRSMISSGPPPPAFQTAPGPREPTKRSRDPDTRPHLTTNHRRLSIARQEKPPAGTFFQGHRIAATRPVIIPWLRRVSDPQHPCYQPTHRGTIRPTTTKIRTIRGPTPHIEPVGPTSLLVRRLYRLYHQQTKNLLVVLQHSTLRIARKVRCEAISDGTWPCRLSTRRQREARRCIPAPASTTPQTSVHLVTVKSAKPWESDWASRKTSRPRLTERQKSQQKSARALPQPLTDGHTVEPPPARSRDGNAVDRPPASGRQREALSGRAPLDSVTDTWAFLQVNAPCPAASTAQAAVPERAVAHRHTPSLHRTVHLPSSPDAPVRSLRGTARSSSRT